MRLLTNKLDALKIGWNIRPQTERDLYRLCRRFCVKVQEMPLRTGGFYYRVKGRDFIAVDSRLPEKEKLVVLFHELGHYLLHVPASGATASFHHVAGPTREESEADVFALCAVLPRPYLESHSVEEMLHDGHSADLIAARLKVYSRHAL